MSNRFVRSINGILQNLAECNCNPLRFPRAPTHELQNHKNFSPKPRQKTNKAEVDKTAPPTHRISPKTKDRKTQASTSQSHAPCIIWGCRARPYRESARGEPPEATTIGREETRLGGGGRRRRAISSLSARSPIASRRRTIRLGAHGGGGSGSGSSSSDARAGGVGAGGVSVGGRRDEGSTGHSATGRGEGRGAQASQARLPCNAISKKEMPNNLGAPREGGSSSARPPAIGSVSTTASAPPRPRATFPKGAGGARWWGKVAADGG